MPLHDMNGIKARFLLDVGGMELPVGYVAVDRDKQMARMQIDRPIVAAGDYALANKGGTCQFRLYAGLIDKGLWRAFMNKGTDP